MKIFAHAVVMSACFLVFSGSARGAETEAAVPFPGASVYLEQNATDGDMEVVFEVKGGQDGLAELSVVSPDGRPVVAFRTPDSSTISPQLPESPLLSASFHPPCVYLSAS